jgi:hypothetical protein
MNTPKVRWQVLGLRNIRHDHEEGQGSQLPRAAGATAIGMIDKAHPQGWASLFLAIV